MYSLYTKSFLDGEDYITLYEALKDAESKQSISSLDEMVIIIYEPSLVSSLTCNKMKAMLKSVQVKAKKMVSMCAFQLQKDGAVFSTIHLQLSPNSKLKNIKKRQKTRKHEQSGQELLEEVSAAS